MVKKSIKVKKSIRTKKRITVNKESWTIKNQSTIKNQLTIKNHGRQRTMDDKESWSTRKSNVYKASKYVPSAAGRGGSSAFRVGQSAPAYDVDDEGVVDGRLHLRQRENVLRHRPLPNFRTHQCTDQVAQFRAPSHPFRRVGRVAVSEFLPPLKTVKKVPPKVPINSNQSINLYIGQKYLATRRKKRKRSSRTCHRRSVDFFPRSTPTPSSPRRTNPTALF